MPESVLTNLDKAAVLLHSLSGDTSARVLELLGNEHAGRLRTAIDSVSRRNDLGDLTKQVTNEFLALQSQVRSGSPSEATVAVPAASWVANQYAQDARGAESATQSLPHRRDEANATDAVATLRQTAPNVLARVLQVEPPRVLVLVLQNLPGDLAAAVLKLLPLELRGDAVTLMATESRISPVVAGRVLPAIAQQCGGLVESSAEEDEPAFRRLAGILQSVDREERMRLMDLLSERDQDMAAKIEELLYDYTDLLRIDDRSLQKILSQVEQKALATALKSASDLLRDKVMKNVSERTRAALVEEMEYLGSVPAAKAELARNAIAGIICAKDKEGKLVWLE